VKLKLKSTPITTPTHKDGNRVGLDPRPAGFRPNGGGGGSGFPPAGLGSGTPIGSGTRVGFVIPPGCPWGHESKA
jgi:hypothetical protein